MGVFVGLMQKLQYKRESMQLKFQNSMLMDQKTNDIKAANALATKFNSTKSIFQNEYNFTMTIANSVFQNSTTKANQEYTDLLNKLQSDGTADSADGKSQLEAKSKQVDDEKTQAQNVYNAATQAAEAFKETQDKTAEDAMNNEKAAYEAEEESIQEQVDSNNVLITEDDENVKSLDEMIKSDIKSDAAHFGLG